MHSRDIHYIISQRLQHPTKKIITRKDNFKSAFHQSHLHASAAVKTLTQIETGSGQKFLLLPLRTTFGGAPGPSEWGCQAEQIIDLAKAILSCKEWDPDKLHLPIKDSIPTAKHLDKAIPIAPARSIIVDIPDNPQGKVNLYIDNGVSISCEPDDGNLQQLENVVPLAIYLVAREMHKHESLPRDDMLTIHKMLAEGAAILGWLYNMRHLQVYLPEHKFIAWSKDIKRILQK